MAPVMLDFGALDLISATSGLRLRLSSNAQFASSGEDAQCPSRLTVAKLTTHSVDRPWITKGSEFHLALDIRFCSGERDRERHRLLETAAETLSTAELWQQIHLKPTSTRLEVRDSEAAGMITIYLAHEEVRTEGPTRQQHKLGQGVPASDVRAPPEIQKVQLDAIRLRMDISCESPLKRRKLAPNLEAKTSFEPDAEHCFGRATEARRSYTAPSQQEHRAISRTQTDPNLPAHCSRYDMLLGSEPAESRIARSNITQSMAQKRSCSTEDLNAAGQQEISRQEFLGILDAGLRMAISPSPKCLARGVRMDGNESCKCLANTLPTLWSPGYLYAMSSRSVLLPTISHGLNGICAEHAKSSRLRSKMIELERRHDARHDYLRHNSDSGRASSTVSSVLWRTMQTSLFDMEAANLLIPLSRKNGDDNLNDLDLLDSRYDETWHNGPHSCTCSDDDESLLDRAEIAEGATALVPGEGLKRRTPACLMPEMSPQMPSGGPLDLGMFEDDEELLSNGESLEHLAGMDDGDMIATETPRLTESQDEGIATVTRHSFNSDDEILPI